MKRPRRALALLLAAGTALWAQDSREQPPAALAPPAAVSRTEQDLDWLLGPIALYPDALIALILPAATVPADVVLAARYLKDNPGDFSQVESRAWDDSVKSLAHYPVILRWLDENLEWTKQVGAAFADEPAEVMKTIQRLRARARAAGALVDTPQQQILSEADVLRIVPGQPDLIYVPRYDSSLIFGYPPLYYSQPLMTFGFGYSVGPWLAYDFDWRHRTIWVGNRHRSWQGHDWHRPVVPIRPTLVNPSMARPWQPPSRPVRLPVAPNYFAYGRAAPPPALPGPATAPPSAPANRGAPAGPRVTVYPLPMPSASPRTTVAAPMPPGPNPGPLPARSNPRPMTVAAPAPAPAAPAYHPPAAPPPAAPRTPPPAAPIDTRDRRGRQSEP